MKEPKMHRNETEKEIRDAYMYGYDRAKKGLNRRDGYTEDYVDAVINLISQVEKEARLKTQIDCYDSLINLRPREHKTATLREYAKSRRQMAMNRLAELTTKEGK